MHSSRRIPTLNQPWWTIRGISRLFLHAPATNASGRRAHVLLELLHKARLLNWQHCAFPGTGFRAKVGNNKLIQWSSP